MNPLDILIQARDAASKVFEKVGDKAGDLDKKIEGVDKTMGRAEKSSFSFARVLETSIGTALGGLISVAGEAAIGFAKLGFEKNAAATEGYADTLKRVQDGFGAIAQIVTQPLFDVFYAGLQGLADLLNSPAFVVGVYNITQALAALPNSPVGQWLTGTLIPALQEAGAKIAEHLAPALERLAPYLEKIGAFLGPLVAQAFEMIGKHLLEVIAATTESIAKFLDAIPVFLDFAETVGGQVNTAVQGFANLWTDINLKMQDAVKFVADTGKAFSDLATNLQGGVASGIQWFVDSVLTPLQNIIGGIVSAIQEAIDLFNYLASLTGANVPTPPTGGAGYERGGSFIVPEGFPRDSFPMRVSSGERVTVTPKSHVGGASSGATFIFNVRVDSELRAQQLARKVRVLAAMGAT